MDIAGLDGGDWMNPAFKEEGIDGLYHDLFGVGGRNRQLQEPNIKGKAVIASRSL
jgi:hypothetical protein